MGGLVLHAPVVLMESRTKERKELTVVGLAHLAPVVPMKSRIKERKASIVVALVHLVDCSSPSDLMKIIQWIG